jgi:hypothetical protein
MVSSLDDVALRLPVIAREAGSHSAALGFAELQVLACAGTLGRAEFDDRP